MKVLHVCNCFYPCVGGIEGFLEELCKNLIELGHQSDVACLNTCAYSKKKLPKYEEYDGIKIYRLPYMDLKFYKIAPGIIRLIKGYDVIHVHGLGFFSDLLSSTKFIHGKHLIFSTHGGIFHTKKLYKIKIFYFNFWCRFALKKFDKIIAVSKSDARLFSKITSNITFIPYAIETEDFGSLMRKPEKNSFLYVGRISRNKRIDNLINTFYFLKKKVPGIKLYIVGGDWEGIKSDLERLALEKGLGENVNFIGEITNKEELLDYYSRAEFFVSASEYEGFGISVLEAMAAGVTIIVNDIDAFRTFVINRNNGFIVDYSSPRKAANTILALLRNESTQIGSNAKKTAKKYDWKIGIKRFEKIYEEVR